MTLRERSKVSTWLLALLLVLASAAAGGATLAEEVHKSGLTLRKGDRIILIGNTFAERMQYYGHFETLLHARFPELELVVHNLGYSADELTLRPRQAHFNDHGHTLKDEKPDVLHRRLRLQRVVRRPGRPRQVQERPRRFHQDIDHDQVQRQRSPAAGAAFADRAGRPQEPASSPTARRTTSTSSSTRGAMAELAAKHGVVFVDLFTPSKQLYESSGEPLTINGIHLSDEGYKLLGAQHRSRHSSGRRPARRRSTLNALYAAVQEKNLQFFYDYRAVNGCYIYGGRKAPFGVVNFPAEFAKLRKMIENRERRVWDIAQGKPVPATIDDSDTGEFASVQDQRQGNRSRSRPRTRKRARSRFPRAMRSTCSPRRSSFPTWKIPVSMTFDAKGRLWVTTMPSYPMYLPGTKPNDKVLILEDTNSDGKADRCNGLCRSACTFPSESSSETGAFMFRRCPT